MRARTRLIAIAATVLALLAPTAVAHADVPPNPILFVTVTPIDAVVFPTVDGYHDTTQFVATVGTDGGARRVRGTVTISLGNRIAKTWPITTSGTTLLTWDGKLGGKVVAGKYAVKMTAVDDDGAVFTDDPRTITVLPKNSSGSPRNWCSRPGATGSATTTGRTTTPACIRSAS